MINPQKEFLNVIKRRFDSIILSRNNACNNYFDIDIFLININSAIQELRNITFILQNNKSLYSNFDSWYSEKQKKMREDKNLKRIVDSRNRIVKQTDLQINSLAYISLLNWLEFNIPPIELDPLLSKDQIIYIISELIEKTELKKISEKFGMPLLRVEKRRIDKEYNGIEILSLIKYGFDFFSILINEFLKLIDIDYSFNKIDIESLQDKQFYLLDINDGSNISITRTDIKDKILGDKKIMKIAKKIIGNIDFTKQTKGCPIDKIIDMYLNVAKKIIEFGETHKPLIVYLSMNYEPINLIRGCFQDRATKYARIRDVARDIKNKNEVFAILLINEAYTVDLKKWKEHEKNPSLKTAKDESLIIIFLNKEGISKEVSIPIYRTTGAVSFGEKKQYSDLKLNILNPIKESWGIEK